MYKQSVLMVFVAVFLVACASQPAPGSPESRLQEVAEEKEIASKRIVEEVANAPDWVKEKPQSDAAMYSTGFATQPAMDLAQRAADNQAAANMALAFAQYVETFNNQYMDGKGRSFQVTSNAVAKQNLKGAKSTKHHFIENNGAVTWYSLFELAYGDANRLIVGEIRKYEDDLLEARKNDNFRKMEEMWERGKL